MTPAALVFDAIDTARRAEYEREQCARMKGETARAEQCAYARESLGRLLAVLRTTEWGA